MRLTATTVSSVIKVINRIVVKFKGGINNEKNKSKYKKKNRIVHDYYFGVTVNGDPSRLFRRE